MNLKATARARKMALWTLATVLFTAVMILDRSSTAATAAQAAPGSAFPAAGTSPADTNDSEGASTARHLHAVDSVSDASPTVPACTLSPQGRCLCPLGTGGPACNFTLASIFGNQSIYASLAGSSDLRPLDLQGWSPGAAVYEGYLAASDAVTVIEVGVWKGASASHMAKWLQRRGHGLLIAVDTWLGAPEFWQAAAMASTERSLQMQHGWPTVFYQFISNVVHQGLEGVVVPLPQTSKLATVILRAHGVTADLVHIDAAHEYGSVCEDLRMWWAFLRPGGILLGDDFSGSWPGVVKAAKEFALVCEVKLEVEGKKWALRRPSEEWAAAHQHLPSYCLHGSTEHYAGAALLKA